MRGRRKKEADSNRKKKLSRKREMSGYRWKKLFTFCLVGTFSLVNKPQLSFVTKADFWNVPQQRSNCFGCCQQGSDAPPKYTHNIQPAPFFQWCSTTLPIEWWSYEESDRMERKLEKQWEITRCLWKTPFCYVPPAHIRVNRVLSWRERAADNGCDGRWW